MNKVILLDKRPLGKPLLSDFKFGVEEVPVPGEGQILLKTLYVSIDPYLRGRMNDIRSYIPPFQLSKPIQSGIVAEVVSSNRTDFKSGDFVSGILEWKEYQISEGKGITRVDDIAGNLSKYLGILGMTGLTAYCGLTEIGVPKAGETIVVSGAAGAVGSVVGQIGKILGCRVVGITGTDEKVQLLKTKFKFDQAVNYKTEENLKDAIGNVCPLGVDVYFDNVGGDISYAVLENLNKYARIPLCGTISLYNEVKPPSGPSIQPLLLVKSSLMRGFIISDFSDKFPQAIRQLMNWLNEGKLTFSETIVDGFDNIPQAFLDLFEGKNEGKMIVKI